MKTSEQVAKIFPAFIKAQSEFSKATKDSNNPFFKSKYADLNSYLDAIGEALSDNDLAVMQDTSGEDVGQIIKVATRLIHSSGEWIESEPLILHPTDMKPQSFGSAQTYARRYSLASFLGLGAEDDDGNHASKKKATPKAKEMPTRAAVNGELLELKTLDEYTSYAKKFQKDHTIAVWDLLSGKRGNNTETWKTLFEMHKKRVLGEQPIDVTKTPEDPQAEFDLMVNKEANADNLKALWDYLDANSCLQNDANNDKLLKIQSELES